MFLSLAGTPVSSKSLSSDVPLLTVLSFILFRNKNNLHVIKIFYFSLLDVLKIVKNKFFILWHNKRLVNFSTLAIFVKKFTVPNRFAIFLHKTDLYGLGYQLSIQDWAKNSFFPVVM